MSSVTSSVCFMKTRKPSVKDLFISMFKSKRSFLSSVSHPFSASLSERVISVFPCLVCTNRPTKDFSNSSHVSHSSYIIHIGIFTFSSGLTVMGAKDSIYVAEFRTQFESNLSNNDLLCYSDK
ncbi:hypothetical protein H2248_001206 [Termitomyces sp. 'cryptogamus']|nr:hypothetical protein H2248_001206 [Termitomyces sp. 'cryptogamus']